MVLAEFLMIIDPVAVLMILIATGYAAYRLGILDRHATHKISLFLLNVSIPALIIVSMQIPPSAALLSNTLIFCIGVVVFYLFAVIVAYIGSSLFTMGEMRRGVFSFGILFGNIGFMGFPIAAALFGPESIFYVAIANLIFNLLIFSAGIVMITGRYEFNLKLLINPGITASLLGLVLFLLEIRIPSPAIDAMRLLGDLTTPLAMLIVGSFLATFPVREMIGDRTVFTGAALRLLLLPAGTYLLLSPLIDDPLVLGILVLLAAMPVGSMTVIFADIYGSDERFASQLVFLSTIVSLLTIPVITLLLI